MNEEYELELAEYQAELEHLADLEADRLSREAYAEIEMLPPEDEDELMLTDKQIAFNDDNMTKRIKAEFRPLNEDGSINWFQLMLQGQALDNAYRNFEWVPFIAEKPQGKGKQYKSPDVNKLHVEPYVQPYARHKDDALADVTYYSTEEFWASYFADVHHEDLRYFSGLEEWRLFADGGWRRVADAEVRQMLEETQKAVLTVALNKDMLYARFFENEKEGETRAYKAYINMRNKVLANRFQIAVVHKLKSQTNVLIPSNIDPFDRDPYQVPLKSYMYNARNHTLEKLSYEHYNSGNFTVDPAPWIDLQEEHTPEWWKEQMPLIWSIFYGIGYDQDKIDMIQGALAETVLGTNNDSLLMLMYGVQRSGKSSIINIMEKVMGPYAQPLDKRNLLKSGYDHHKQEIAQTKGKRMTITSELKNDETLDGGFVKEITGSDTIQANKMHQNSLAWKSGAVLWLTSNEMIHIDTDDAALWERVKVIQWTKVRPTEERIPNFSETVSAEYPVFLSWILEGVHRIMTHGLFVPEVVDVDTKVYQQQNDTILMWAEDNLSINSEDVAGHAALRENYERWCKSNGVTPLKTRDWREALLEAFPEVKHPQRNGRYVFVGIGLA